MLIRASVVKRIENGALTRRQFIRKNPSPTLTSWVSLLMKTFGALPSHKTPKRSLDIATYQLEMTSIRVISYL